MTPAALFATPFFQVTLPLMVTFSVGVWAMISSNNRRLDDVVKRLDAIERRLDAIEARLTAIETGHGASLAALEERTRIVRS